MVDVLSTRLQEVYAKWETRTEMIRNANPTTAQFSLDGLRRAGTQLQTRKMQEKDWRRTIRKEQLYCYSIKNSIPRPLFMKRNPPFVRYCCHTCTPDSKNSLINSIKQQQQRFDLNILMVKRGPTFFSKVFNYVSQVSNFKSFDYPMVTQTVLNNERLKEVINLTTCEITNNENCNEKEVTMAKNKTKNILLQMESRCSDILLKIVAWLLYKLLPSFIQSAIVTPSQIEVLKKANDTGLPLIFLPLHRSHLDYIMISFIMVVNNMRNPLIAAGDNLKIPFFGWLLRGLGAFFIKRRMDAVVGRKDVLYRTVLQTYIMESLRAGHNLEFFVEGGRTRTGKPCMPKSGILSVIIDAYMDGTIEDALLIPVAMNYERLVDGNFVREQLGQPKKMETFASTIKAMWSTLRGHYGIVKINFCQPFSLREMIKSFQAQQNKTAKLWPERSLKSSRSSSSIYGTDVVVEEHRQLVDRIARHVVYDSSKSTPIMSTNVVAFLLLNRFRNGCTLDKLVEAFDSIRKKFQYYKDIVFCGESVNIIKHALDILGPDLVTQQQQEITDVDGESVIVTTIRPVSILPNIIELSYYSNAMLAHYIKESIIITALYAELQSQINDPVAIAENNITLYQDNLVNQALKLCDILRYEFIFCKPCKILIDVVIKTIEDLPYIHIMPREDYLNDRSVQSNTKRRLGILADSSDEEYDRREEIIQKQIEVSKIKYKLDLTPKHFAQMEFLHMILRPLIDTYTCSAFNLRKLVGHSLCERDLVREVLSEIQTSLDHGTINYGESLCVDPIKNSLKLFEYWDVLECYMQENLKMFCLKEEHNTDTAAENIYDALAVFKWTRDAD
ncbi:glycerol-3-phosphate acyltransferase 1, mitochondrial isoform X2 [Harpegnathos saltator]|nr:glycerol-3-phosphate acyltransferase 1, mitochondrial isoform X2 [Harpegnathos saltator]XP_025161685.1 glycerol-3-phosphate acyltransferase 1, mitochondrial isoform X2 [Harpegnathos saltator]